MGRKANRSRRLGRGREADPEKGSGNQAPREVEVGCGQCRAPRLTPGALLSVVTELYALGLRVEDVGTATLLDHVLLEAGVNAHLKGKEEARGFRPGPPHPGGPHIQEG